MMKDYKSSLRFINYLVERIEFESNFDFSGEDKPITFDLNDSSQFDDDKFVLTLDLTVFPEAKENDYPFTMNMRITGLFEVDSSLDEKMKKDFINKNAIAILFPYLRAMASVYSVNANVGTLVLPPINVVKYLQNKKNNKYSKQ